MKNVLPDRVKFDISPDAQIARANQRIAQATKLRERIAENVERHRTQTPEERTSRLRGNRVRRGLNKARYMIDEKCTNKQQVRRCFEAVYAVWRSSKTGFDGVELTELEISKRLDCSERHVRRLIGPLCDLGLVVTIRQSGKANRYAVALPEPEPYLQAVEYALLCDVAQALEQYGVDGLEVALHDEAVEAGFISVDPGHIAA